MRRLILLSVLFSFIQAVAEERAILPLWNGPAPGETGEIDEEKFTPRDGNGVSRLYNVSKPSIEHFRAPTEGRTGASVIVCPGGGYRILAIDHEGSDVCRWLNSIGVDAFLLRYRVPRREGIPAHQVPLMDAQRSISLVRSKAKEFDVDPGRLGILGFSAGGNLAALAATNFDKERDYPIEAAIDKQSCRPDFVILVYPAYLLDDKTGELRSELAVTKKTPPIFMAHTDTDHITAAGSATLYLALKKAGVSAELHVYADGGHGFGMRMTENPGTFDWTLRASEWMENRGWLKK